MMHARNPSTVTLLVLLPLLAWRVYARFGRMIGRQRLSAVRLWITLAVFSALVLFLFFSAVSHAEQLWWLAGGLSVGSLLGILGFNKTRFEPTPQGLFYTPDAHLGIALSLLLVARIVYRLVEIYALDTTMPRGIGEFARSSPTLAIFGLLAGYYISYAMGLVYWRFRVLRAERQREVPKVYRR